MRLIRNTVNTGFAHANNQAIRDSRGDYILLLNSDILVNPGALATLVAGQVELVTTLSAAEQRVVRRAPCPVLWVF